MEAVISAALMGVLALGMGGAVMVAAKAIPTETADTQLRRDVTGALDQLCSELRLTTGIKSQDASSITFIVPDRTGDSVDDQLRYAWDGGTLRRSLNGGADAAIMDGVKDVSFTSIVESTTTSTAKSGVANSGEVLLAEFKSWPIAVLPGNVYTTLSIGMWATINFQIDKVAMPSDTTRVELTKARVYLRQGSGTTTSVLAAIYNPGSGVEPSSTVIGGWCSVPSANLAAPVETRFIDLPLKDVIVNSRQTTFNLVMMGNGAGSGVLQSYNSVLATGNNCTFLTSTNYGSSWNPSLGRNQNDAPFEIWGNYSWPSVGVTTGTIKRLKAVEITIFAGAAVTQFQASARTLNEPEVP